MKKKPYVELPDSDGRDDAVVAKEWWDYHTSREDSFIARLFDGQFKSLISCCACKHESARFEPFSFLGVPLPDFAVVSSFVGGKVQKGPKLG